LLIGSARHVELKEEYPWFKEREDGMETLSDTLTQRVEGLLKSHHHEKLLTTTGTPTLVWELVERTEGLELVVRELALEVERLAATIEKTDNR
jgi:hypothetical protein